MNRTDDINQYSKADPFEEYERASDPSKRELSYLWQTAIGLQAVDGLKVSDISQITEGSRLTIVMRDGKVTFTASNIAAERKEQ